MAEDSAGKLIDPYGGRGDLAARRLRHVSPAFVEDPLRVLRVARFAARLSHLGFQVAAETRQLMRDISDSGELEHLAAERIWAELERALAAPTPAAFFQVLLDCGALPALFPEWAPVIDPPLLEALQRAVTAEADIVSRFALMCSPLSPPHCRQLCQQLKAPKQHGALALLVCRLSPLPHNPNPETLLRLLETMDCLRRPAQVERLLAAEQALYPAFPSLALYHEAAQRIREISPQPLLEQGLRGEALGRALRARRLQAVEELLCRNPSPSP
jgi:tRNA nucleotidyltransferase (CCA-adding enzyme)